MPEPDLALLLDAARAAGEIALRHWGRSPEAWDKGGGAGPVSEADLEVDRMLRAELLASRPGYGWLSEETADGPERLAAERVFVIDPIDGTRAFLKNEAGFAHSLAVVENGRVVAGVVHLPKLGATYAAAEGDGATLNDRPIRPSARARLEGATVLSNAGNFRPELWRNDAPNVRRQFRPSLAHRVCLTADGQFDAMLALRGVWEWDVAAGDLIAREAGAAVTTADGSAPRYNSPEARLSGIVAAGPALHRAMMARLRHEGLPQGSEG